MKVRLAAPTVLVDLRNIPGLHGIQQANGGWRIGPMTRHADLQDDDRARRGGARRRAHRAPACATAARSEARSPTAIRRWTRRGARLSGGRGRRAGRTAADDRRRRPVPGLPHVLDCARRGDHGHPAPRPRGIRVRLSQVHAPGRGLVDGRRVRCREPRPRHLRGRAHRADTHGCPPRCGRPPPRTRCAAGSWMPAPSRPRRAGRRGHGPPGA